MIKLGSAQQELIVHNNQQSPLNVQEVTTAMAERLSQNVPKATSVQDLQLSLILLQLVRGEENAHQATIVHKAVTHPLLVRLVPITLQNYQQN